MDQVNHVIQIGDVRDREKLYLEDYAYTYLKQREPSERRKYYLYGKREEDRLVVYGITDSQEAEHTYFREFDFLGQVKVKGKDKYQLILNGQELTLKGFYVFYAANQPMQDYLVDTGGKRTGEEETTRQIPRRGSGQMPPVKEVRTTRSWGKYKNTNRKKEKTSLVGWVLPFAGIFALVLGVAALSGTESRSKLELFRRVAAETLGIGVEESSEELVIEEKRVGDDIDLEEADSSLNDASAALSDMSPGEDISQEDGSSAEAVSSITSTSVGATSGQEAAAATSSGGEQTNGQEDGTQQAAEETEEYIVKEGDTLAAICKYKYGSLTRLKDICSLNHIKDADYIAPGQKLYLPE